MSIAYTGKKESHINTQWWENWISSWRRMKLDLNLSYTTKVDLKYLKGLIIMPEVLGDNMQDTWRSRQGLVQRPLVSQKTISRTVRQMGWQSTKKKIKGKPVQKRQPESRDSPKNGVRWDFANGTAHRVFPSRVYYTKNYKNYTSKLNHPNNKSANELNR